MKVIRKMVKCLITQQPVGAVHFWVICVTPQTHTKDLDAQLVLKILNNIIMEQSVIKYPQINFK